MKSGNKGSRPPLAVYRNVEMGLIDPPESHVRMDIPERQIFELSESMKEVGLIQAILITPVNKRFEVVVGHRRYLAAKKLNWDKIKVEVRKLDKKEISILRATENLQREGLTPIEEAAIYVDLYNESGFTNKMIAEKMGKAPSYIIEKMELLKMEPMVQKAVHEGKVKEKVAKVLSRIEDKKELYHYLELAIEHGITVKIAKMWVDGIRQSLQYINSREEPGSGQADIIIPEKQYKACDICEAPMEYQDIQLIRICKSCFRDVKESIKQRG